jgi:predicted AlkP superfamily pyrophosphatase or phosphodiesterase
MKLRLAAWLALATLLSIGCGKDTRSPPPVNNSPAPAVNSDQKPAAQDQAKNAVLWISVDGFRGNYVDRGETPYLQSLMKHGAYTKQLVPVFPSLTFPSHVSESTGVLPGVHGIVSNKYYDTATRLENNFPGDPTLLLAEPIWLSASRQGVRTAVYDWPLSQAEEKLPEGTPRAAYFHPKYDNEPTDPERIGKLVETYRADSADAKNAEPLRLLMGYVHDVDSAGHKVGPDAAETNDAIRNTDKLLRQVIEQVAEIFKQRAKPDRGDALYVLITTDHGMIPITHVVNVDKLIAGPNVSPEVIAYTSGSLANIYLTNVKEEAREKARETIVARLKEAEYLKFWLRDELPAKWNFANPTRTGDIVVSLNPGYHFNSKAGDIVVPVEVDPKGLKGMHGYDPAEAPEMLGFTVLYRFGSDQPGVDLGQVDSLRIHPTVAKLLGIKPAEGAKAEPIDAPR